MTFSDLHSAQVFAILSSLPTKEGEKTGKNAESLTKEEALRIYGRMMRRERSTGRPMSLDAIVKRSAYNARRKK